MLVSELIKVLILFKLPIKHGKLKLPASFSLGGSLCCIIVLHFLVKANV